MKNMLALFMLSFTFVSCSSDNESNNNEQENSTTLVAPYTLIIAADNQMPNTQAFSMQTSIIHSPQFHQTVNSNQFNITHVETVDLDKQIELQFHDNSDALEINVTLWDANNPRETAIRENISYKLKPNIPIYNGDAIIFGFTNEGIVAYEIWRNNQSQNVGVRQSAGIFTPIISYENPNL